MEAWDVCSRLDKASSFGHVGGYQSGGNLTSKMSWQYTNIFIGLHILMGDLEDDEVSRSPVAGLSAIEGAAFPVEKQLKDLEAEAAGGWEVSRLYPKHRKFDIRKPTDWVVYSWQNVYKAFGGTAHVHFFKCGTGGDYLPSFYLGNVCNEIEASITREPRRTGESISQPQVAWVKSFPR